MSFSLTLKSKYFRKVRDLYLCRKKGSLSTKLFGLVFTIGLLLVSATVFAADSDDLAMNGKVDLGMTSPNATLEINEPVSNSIIVFVSVLFLVRLVRCLESLDAVRVEESFPVTGLRVDHLSDGRPSVWGFLCLGQGRRDCRALPVPVCRE